MLHWVLLGVTVVLAGCGSGTTRKSALIKSTKHVESSAAEIRSRDQSLLGLYSAEIESAADKIRSESPSLLTRRQALVWKTEAIPALQTSMLNTDPFAAALDTWAFILQMKTHMEQPALKQRWGESYATAATTLAGMDAQMEQMLRAAAPSADVVAVRQKIDAWANAHPIVVSLAGRQSLDADLIRRTEQTDLRAAASIRAIEESIGDLTARLDSYNTYLPKQARWQAELLLSDLAHDPQVNAAMSRVAALSGTLEKASSNMDRLPEFMGEARKAALADFEGQRLATQAFVREERLETINALNQARMATLLDLRKERLAATEDLRSERKIVLDSIRDNTATVMNDVNAATEKALVDFDARARGLIDHFFVRALELVLLVMILSLLTAWILLRRFTARGQDRGERLQQRAA